MNIVYIDILIIIKNVYLFENWEIIYLVEGKKGKSVKDFNLYLI